MRRVLVGYCSLLLCTGCAGIAPAQLGQTLGTIAGAAVAPGVGAPIGALVGLLAGMVVQGKVDQATEKRERKELGDQLTTGSFPASEGSVPAPQGEPTRVWVDEAVQSGRLVAGHFEVRPVP